MNERITPLEKTALKMLASRARKHEQLILSQIAQAQVETRKRTSAGFITNFTIPSDIATLSTNSKRKLLEIYAEHPNVPAGAEFLLWFEYGRLICLEGYVFIGNWPSDESGFYFVTPYDSLCAELLNTEYIENYNPL